jgi:hypothetical protein
MRYQISIILTDGSKFYLEKINITKKEVRDVKEKFKIPDYFSDKALFVAKLFNEYEMKIITDFLIKNDYVKIYKVSKINPFILEDDVIPFSKVSQHSSLGSEWETISFGQINHMYVMGYGSIKENLNRRQIERNYQGTLILLELINAEKTINNIEKLQNYLQNVKHITDVSEYANKILNAKESVINKVAEEFKRLIYPEALPKESISDTKKEHIAKIIKVPKNNWQAE